MLVFVCFLGFGDGSLVGCVFSLVSGRWLERLRLLLFAFPFDESTNEAQKSLS